MALSDKIYYQLGASNISNPSNMLEMIPLPAATFGVGGEFHEANNLFSDLLINAGSRQLMNRRLGTIEVAFRELVDRLSKESLPLIVSLPTFDGEINFSAWLKKSAISEDQDEWTLILVDAERSISDRKQALIYATELQELYDTVREHYPRLRVLHQASETLQQNLESVQVASIGLSQMQNDYGCAGLIGVVWGAANQCSVFVQPQRDKSVREVSLTPSPRQVRALRGAAQNSGASPKLLPKWVREGLETSIGESYVGYRISTTFVTQEGNIGFISLPQKELSAENWYLQSFVDQLSMALRNAVLYDDLLAQSNYTNALLHSSEALSRSVRMSDVLAELPRLVADQVLDTEGVVSVSLESLDEEVVVSGYVRGADGKLKPLAEHASTTVEQHGQPDIQPPGKGVTLDRIHYIAEQMLAGPGEAFAVEFDLGGQHGEVTVHTPNGMPLNDSKIRLLKAITDHARVALSRALLFARQRTGSIEIAQQRERRSQLLLQMAHELKTPLTAIRPLVDILGASSGSTTEEQRDEIISILRRGIDRLENVGNRYLDGFESPEDPTRKLASEVVDLSRLVSQVTAMHAQAFSQAGQRIFVSPDSESGVIIFADAGAIEEVLTNIISNCHKHAGQGASICVRITKNKDQTASVEVIDDGFGMTPDVLKNTRKAMQNPNSILTGKNHLGLQISARLIALHGGASWIKSRSRRGTTVGFSLPSE